MEKKKAGNSKMIGKVIDINDDISIFADKYQYIVRLRTTTVYLASLQDCFQFIFEEEIKIRLIENPKKNIEEIVKIHKETAQWLRGLFKKIEEPQL